MSLSKSVLRWAFYDFANSSYVLIYQAFLLPVYFSTVLLSKGYSLSAWGMANGISTLLGVILAILMGKRADRHSRLKIFKETILACFLGMVALSLSTIGLEHYILYIYIFTNSLFIASLSLSDSILPHITEKKDVYESSGFAWGFGYIGGIVSLTVVIILQRLFSEYSPAVFLSVALFYLLFSLYALNGLKEASLNEPPPPQKIELITRKQKSWLLLGYWLISESITVAILFFTIFCSKEVGFSNLKIGIILLLMQIIGFPATWFGGWLTKKISPLFLLGVTIGMWIALIVIIISSPGLFGVISIILLAGLAVGNSQSILRAQYSTLIHKSESGLQFGIYAFISQAAVSIGPILYGLASDALKSQKIPMMILIGLMIAGFLLIWRVITNLRSPI